ncbi:MAG TPA: sulfite exporter TauE/SafE family protein [Mycobacterium sp.]|nr:sulfite exporter TauE/SafE family protein [Mycobacterium sp.]
MDWLFLAGAGVLGGLTGSIAGLASVATYPALLLVGLPPVTANVTNTVALVFNGVGSVWGSRPELEGQQKWIMRIAPVAVLGGAAGAALLLSTPAEGFEKVVPILLGLASAAILLPRRGNRRVRVADHQRHTAGVLLESTAIFLICIYGGYFGAAAGVLLLALLLRAGHATLAHANAGKNVILGIANGVAAIIFAFLAPVHWPAVLALGIGCLIGSRLGPIVVRHAPAAPLRAVIGVAGLALAVKLGIDAYV